MKVKKYVAKTMPEAMNQIRSEFGSEAVILNTKEVKHGGIFGLFKKKSFEVVAALDPKPYPRKQPVTENKVKTTETKKGIPISSEVLKEINHLKKLINQQSLPGEKVFPADYQLVFQQLLDQEITYDLAKEIMESVLISHSEYNAPPNSKEIITDVQATIKEKLNSITFSGINYTKKVIHLIGPTGVGKTTTLAKLAAASMLKDKKKVAFITADTYRIAAIEQLRTYAQILDIPLEVAHSFEDYQKAIEKFSDFDLILVDTAGRNYRNERYVKELKGLIDFKKDVETYLVLSLTAKPNDILDLYHQFKTIPIKEIIFTKVDETKQFGSILNIALLNNIGIAYLTNGQDVPDDLVRPSPEQISALIAGAMSDE